MLTGGKDSDNHFVLLFDVAWVPPTLLESGSKDVILPMNDALGVLDIA